MLNIVMTLVLGAFLIYGLDDLGIINADDFKAVEKADSLSEAEMGDGKGSHVQQPVYHGRFTDRIVNKRKQLEG